MSITFMTRVPQPNIGCKRAQRRVSLLLGRTKRLLELEREKAHGIQGNLHERGHCELREMGRLHRTFRLLADSLRESEKERHLDLREYLSGALLPLQPPLTQAGSAARQLLGENGSAHERRQWLDAVIQGVTEMEMIVSRLQEEIRPVNKPTHRLEALDFVTLAFEVLDGDEYSAELTSRCGHQSIGFRGDPPGECLVWGDRALLKRLLIKLLSTVAASSALNQDLRVSVWRHDSQVILMVEGCGLDLGGAPKPYLPFLPLDETPSFVEQQDAALASIKHVADAHGAQIKVRGNFGGERAFVVKFDMHTM